MNESTVIVAAGPDRRELVREALTALGDSLRDRIKAAKKILIHPNMVNFHRPGACTHVDAVRGVLDHISLLRGDQVIVADAGYHDTEKAFETLDYPSLSRSGNVKLVDLNKDETVPSFAYTAKMEKRPLGFSKTVAETDFNVVVVPAKMHSYYFVSLSLKTHIVGSEVVERSPFGIHARWPWLHTGYKPAHRTLADVYADYPAQLAVIDGTQAMEGNGPADGRVLNLGWLVASFNPVAADAAAAHLMGIDPRDLGFLHHLNEKGLGPIDPREMKIEGANPNKLRRELVRPDSYPALLDWK